MSFTTSHIRSYLDGTMPEEERTAFDKALAADEDLQKMVEGYTLLQAQRGDADVWLAAQKTELNQTESSQPKTWIKYAVAAGLAGLLLWGGYQYVASNARLPYDFQDSGLPVLMGPELNAMNDVMNAYKAGDIAAAQLQLEQYITDYGNSDTTQYYMGVFLKEQQLYDRALPYFVPEDIEQITLKQKAEMQRAICLMYLGREQESQDILDKIGNDSGHLFYGPVDSKPN